MENEDKETQTKRKQENRQSKECGRELDREKMWEGEESRGTKLGIKMQIKETVT